MPITIKKNVQAYKDADGNYNFYDAIAGKDYVITDEDVKEIGDRATAAVQGEIEEVDSRLSAEITEMDSRLSGSIAEISDGLKKAEIFKIEPIRNYGKNSSVYTKTGYQSYTGWFSTDFIDVNDLKIDSITVSRYVSIYAIAFFDGNENFIGGILGDSNKNEPKEFKVKDIPSDAVYVKFSYIDIGGTELNTATSYNNVSVLENRVTSMEYELSSIEHTFDESSLVRREVYTDGGWKDFQTWYSTYIDVDTITKIDKVTCSTYGANIYSYAFFDKDNVFISGHKEGGNRGWKTFENIYIPTNAKYFSCIGASNEGSGLANFKVETLLIKTQSERYDELVKLQKANEEVSEKVYDLSASYNGMYFDDILCIGDSLTQGDYGSYPEGTVNVHKWNYPSYLAEIAHATVTNKGHCGATCVSYWNNDVPTIDTLKEYEAIYIFLGTNGGLSDTVNTDAVGNDYRNYNQTTQTGAYCSIVSWCKEKFPKAKIFLLNFPYNSRSEAWTNSNSAIVAKIGAKFNVPVLDIMNKSPFTRDNGQIYRPVGYDETLEPNGNLHFGRLGYLTLANVVYNLTAEEIKNNPLDYALGY